jgi:hypothetical protein
MGEVPCGICGRNVQNDLQWARVGGLPYCMGCLGVSRIWQEDWKGCPICGAPAQGFGQGFEVTESSIIGSTFSCNSCHAQWKIVVDFRIIKGKGFLGIGGKDEVFAKVEAELVRNSSDGRGTLGQRWPVEWAVAREGKPYAVKKWTDLPPNIRDELAKPRSK